MSKTTPNYGFIKPELIDVADITAFNKNWDILDEKLNGLHKPQCVSYTLLASGWVGTTAPYTYTITGYDNNTVEVVEDVSMTSSQLAVIENAKIKSNPSVDENILYAFGAKPTVDVPVLLLVR